MLILIVACSTDPMGPAAMPAPDSGIAPDAEREPAPFEPSIAGVAFEPDGALRFDVDVNCARGADVPDDFVGTYTYEVRSISITGEVLDVRDGDGTYRCSGPSIHLVYGLVCWPNTAAVTVEVTADTPAGELSARSEPIERAACAPDADAFALDVYEPEFARGIYGGASLDLGFISFTRCARGQDVPSSWPALFDNVVEYRVIEHRPGAEPRPVRLGQFVYHCDMTPHDRWVWSLECAKEPGVGAQIVAVLRRPDLPGVSHRATSEVIPWPTCEGAAEG